MRVVLLGWCPTSEAYLTAIQDAGAVPALVVGGMRGGAAMERACEVRGVPFERREDVNSPGFVARVRGVEPDLLVVAGCGQILRRELRGAFRVGAVNLHPSLLPAYRGREPLFWAILHGEERVGVTAHHITDEVDRGPILLAREVGVGPRATSASLAAEVEQAGAGVLRELLETAGDGLPEGRAQEGEGSYFPPIRPEHGRIDWGRGAREIDRLVRACAGEMAAHASFEGMKLVVVEGAPVDAQGEPGEVLAVEGGAVVVAAGEGALAVRRFVFLQRAREAEELAAELGIAPGRRLDGGAG